MGLQLKINPTNNKKNYNRYIFLIKLIFNKIKEIKNKIDNSNFNIKI